MTSALPCIYSFRRCPYAMRARLGLLFATIEVELREVSLKSKPVSMLAISPKGTVPVLQATDGTVIEESVEIIFWALEQNDSQHLLDKNILAHAHALIAQNDNEFKYWLDRYKYADRYPEMTQIEYRQRCEVFLQPLEALLTKHDYLLSNRPSIADISIMPFIRQFAHVDRDTFDRLPYPRLQFWLKNWLHHPLFLKSMVRFIPWQEGDERVIFSAQY